MLRGDCKHFGYVASISVILAPPCLAALRIFTEAQPKHFKSASRLGVFEVIRKLFRHDQLPQQHESRSHNNGWQDGPEKQFYR